MCLSVCDPRASSWGRGAGVGIGGGELSVFSLILLQCPPCQPERQRKGRNLLLGPSDAK